MLGMIMGVTQGAGLSGYIAQNLYQIGYPMIADAAGISDSKVGHIGMQLGIAGTAAAVAALVFGGPAATGIAGFGYGISSALAHMAFGSVISSGIGVLQNGIKTYITEPILEKYDLESWENYVDGAADIAEGMVISQVANGINNVCGKEINSMTGSLQSSLVDMFHTKEFTNNTLISYTNDSGNNDSGNITDSSSNLPCYQYLNPLVWLQGAFNGMQWLAGGSNNTANSNFISNGLQQGAVNSIFFGIIKIGSAIFSDIFGYNKAYGLSVYDVRKIMKSEAEAASLDVNSKELKEQIKTIAEQHFAKLQQCENYVDSLEDSDCAKVMKLVEIMKKFSPMDDTVKSLPLDGVTPVQKQELSNAEIFKSAMVEAQIVSMLANADQMKKEINMTCKQYHIELTNNDKIYASKMAQMQLNQMKTMAGVSASDEIEAMNMLYQPMYLQMLQGTVQQKFMIMLQEQDALADNHDGLELIGHSFDAAML